MVSKAKVPAAKAPSATPTGFETLPARSSPNAWHCPWDDRAMTLLDPCDVCGAVFEDGMAARRAGSGATAEVSFEASGVANADSDDQ